MALALAGTAVFFSLVTALAVLPAWTGKERGRLEDALALALNAFLAFPLLYFTIEKDHRVALMALTLAGGAVFAIIRLRLSLREEGQSPLSLAALCLAMAFLTIAFPLKLGLWGLPIAWAAEGTALLYLGFLLPNVWMLSGAAAVHFLAGVYLLTHLPLHRAPFIPVLNGAFLSWAFVIAALFFSSALARRDGPELREPWRRRAAVFGVVTYTGAGVALLLLGLREVQESYGLLLNLKAYHATPWHWLLFAAFPFLFALRARCTLADIDSRLTHAAFIVAAAAFVWGLGAYRPAGHLAIINSWFLAGLLLAGSFALGAAIGRRLAWPELPYYHGASLAALFLLLSVECFQSFLRWQALGRSAKHWAFASLSVLWAAYAAALLAAGLRRNQRALRLAAFGLFGLTVVKVLLIDTAELEAVYRILGCLTLGALLVTGSFAYTRFLRGGAAPPQQG
jgi:hypothetical protein